MSRKPNWKISFLLAILLTGLTYLVFWLEFKHNPQQEEAQLQLKKPFPLKDLQINNISIKTNENSFVFQCLDLDKNLCKPGDRSNWEVVSPIKLKADSSHIESLLSHLNKLTYKDTIDLSLESPKEKKVLLDDYGLSPSLIKTITVTTVSDSFTVKFGNKAPITNNHYLINEKDNSKVHLVGAHLANFFKKPLTHWRDKKIFAFSPHEVSAFSLDNKNGTITAKKENNRWLIKKDNSTSYNSGDIESIDRFLNAVSYIKTKEFATESKASVKSKKLLNNSKITVKFSFAKKDLNNKNEIKLEIFETQKKGKKGQSETDKLFAKVSNLDPLFELNKTTSKKFLKSLDDFRLTKLITSMERFSAKKLEFAGNPFGPTPVIIQSSNSDWNYAGGSKSKLLDKKKITSFLDKISGNPIKEFLSGKNIPPGEKKGIQFTLKADGDSIKRKFLFWKNKNKLYAKDLLSTKKEAFLIDLKLKNHIPWKKDFFETKETKK